MKNSPHPLELKSGRMEKVRGAFSLDREYTWTAFSADIPSTAQLRKWISCFERFFEGR